jgi:hypothetical protein
VKVSFEDKAVKRSIYADGFARGTGHWEKISGTLPLARSLGMENASCTVS